MMTTNPESIILHTEMIMASDGPTQGFAPEMEAAAYYLSLLGGRLGPSLSSVERDRIVEIGAALLLGARMIEGTNEDEHHG